jgi:hypothetical protein
MEVVDHKVGVPMEHYKSVFAAADPAAMSERSHVPYADGQFSLTLLGRPVTVSWPEMVSRFSDDGAETASNTRILLARLLLEGALVPAKGELLAYTDMPWGNVYAQQFRGRCILRLAGTYGASLAAFDDAAARVAGKAAESGDRSYDLPFLEGLTVRLILWEGDEEFRPTAQILFSDNFSAAFGAEDIAVVGDVLLNAMKGRW